ncbi:DinB family protein [uncultured Paludibaculum sp.]|uniref:DinB family protein n=1 Tax=uncultured Paludibaculum sp. TaxID=1765020 RepID=UPI002AABCF5E|nr:DinB family protein [uncultured Paludibaculum sp.]
MRFAAFLEAGRQEFLDTLKDLTPEQASAKPDPGRWSVVECIEHVVAVEERHLRWIELGRTIEPQRDDDRELRLFTNIRNRFTQLESPEAMRPKGRFDGLEDARSAFLAVRQRTIALADSRGDDLYAISVKHPFFGPVNGAELIQLIDGHARRHADQIREMLEAGPLPPSTPDHRPRSGKDLEAPRERPALPGEFPAPNELERLFADADITIQRIHVQGLERNGLKASTFRAEASILENVRLADAEFGLVVWRDVRLVGCDLANLHAQRIVLERVEFVDCRMTGLSAAAIEGQDVLIRNSDLRYASFQGARFRNSEFEGSNWREVDLRDADLSGTIIRGCQLGRADLQGATVQGVDFRTSQLEDMLVGLNDLRGAIVEPGQAMVFARVLGVKIV